MPVYELQADGFRQVNMTTFQAEGLGERSDLQRLLRHQIDVIAPDLLVIAEEFSQWEDSNRRIDLLALDKHANLVVIELKITQDGGHMELQSIRYAAMIAAMTFDQTVDVFHSFLRQHDRDQDAESTILEFLGWPEANDEDFAQDVRIILVSPDFSKEITSTVLWLNERGLNIECFGIQLYRDAEQLLVDIQKLIPLPEAEEYQVRVREKHQRQRQSRAVNRDLTKYDVTIAGESHTAQPKRKVMQLAIRHLLEQGHKPESIIDVVGRTNILRIADGVFGKQQFVQWLTANDPGFVENRYFCNDDRLIHVDGKTIAVTNQWGGDMVRQVNELRRAFPQTEIDCKVAFASE